VKEKNKKLAKNTFLMFLVYFLPKVFSFFLVPLYTTYLSTTEYGISDIIISTASFFAPFVALETPGAVFRFTIENKGDKRPYQVAIRIFVFGISVFIVLLIVTYLIKHINPVYLLFVYFIVGTSLLSDINLSYTRGIEKMKIVTLCGVGSSLIGILSNIVTIVILHWGLFGFLISSIMGYTFNILVLLFANRKEGLLCNILKNKEPKLRHEMLSFSVPSIFSGLSWWVISSSDRYFVTLLCGAAANGVYSIAYKIPTILQALDNVFGKAWIYTLYDSYKTDKGREYLSKIIDMYNFLFCFGCSILISLDLIVSKILYSKDFFLAWRYAPLLLISVAFSSASSLMGKFCSVYKKTKISMRISLLTAATNIVLNWVFIIIFNDAIGAAVATAVTFFVSWLCYTIVGTKLSNVKINWTKQIIMYCVLILQTVIILYSRNAILAGVGVIIILLININTIGLIKRKGKLFFEEKRKKINQGNL